MTPPRDPIPFPDMEAPRAPTVGLTEGPPPCLVAVLPDPSGRGADHRVTIRGTADGGAVIDVDGIEWYLPRPQVRALAARLGPAFLRMIL